MAPKYKSNYTYQHQGYTASKIKDSTSKNNFGVILYSQRNLENMRRQSGALANGCEYQVHIRTQTLRTVMKDSGGKYDFFDISVPVLMYNYEQIVSGASVDFHLQDVTDLGEQLMPIFEMQKNKLFETPESFGHQLEALVRETFENHDCRFEWMSSGLNNIHRHPGAMHSFSGTDYCKTENDPGICFPATSADKQAIFSSIITHASNGSVLLGHSEYRIINGDISHANGINYYHGKSTAIIRKDSAPLPIEPEVYGLLNVLNGEEIPGEEEPISEAFIATEAYRAEDGLKDMVFLDKLEDLWIKSNFQAHDSCILPENVKGSRASNFTIRNLFFGDEKKNKPVKKAKKEEPAFKRKQEPITPKGLTDADLEKISIIIGENQYTVGDMIMMRNTLCDELSVLPSVIQLWTKQAVVAAWEKLD